MFKTGFWVQNHLLNLCSRVINLQRLFCSQKSLVKCSYKRFRVYKNVILFHWTGLDIFLPYSGKSISYLQILLNLYQRDPDPQVKCIGSESQLLKLTACPRFHYLCLIKIWKVCIILVEINENFFCMLKYLEL